MKVKSMLKVSLLVLLAAVLGMSFFPSAGVQAAGTAVDAADRLEQVFARQQAAHARQGRMLAQAREMRARLETLIGWAEQQGWDSTNLQQALTAYDSALGMAGRAHQKAARIIAEHPGFGRNGKVVDRAQAAETVKTLGAALDEVREALTRAGSILRESLREFFHSAGWERPPGRRGR
jgi:hypothetical protein